MKGKIITIILIIIAAVAVRLWISHSDQMKTAQMMKNKKAPEVTVALVQDADIIRSYDAPGRVTSKYRVDVMARISGYLQKSFFKEGDYVRAGQTLFEIEPAEYSNAAKVAQADNLLTPRNNLFVQKSW